MGELAYLNRQWIVSGYKETVMTEELLKKKAIKSERRREVAAQKREKEKVKITYDETHVSFSSP